MGPIEEAKQGIELALEDENLITSAQYKAGPANRNSKNSEWPIFWRWKLLSWPDQNGWNLSRSNPRKMKQSDLACTTVS